MKMAGTLTQRSGSSGIISTSTLTSPNPNADARLRQQ
jgi:hypothetical protein